MASSASDVPVTKSESAPANHEAPAVASGASSESATGAASEAPTAASSGAATGAASEVASAPVSGAGSGEHVAAAVAASDGQLAHEAEAGHHAQPDLSDASVTKEEMEHYIKISRDLKLRRGSLMPPGGMGSAQSGKNINATTTGPMPLCAGAKKKPSLTMETRVELYGRGRIKFNFDGVSEEPAAAAGGAPPPQQPVVVHQEESATSLVKRGGPSTAITPRRLSLEERAPPPTPAPSLASLHKRCKSQDFGTIPLKDDEQQDPS